MILQDIMIIKTANKNYLRFIIVVQLKKTEKQPKWLRPCLQNYYSPIASAIAALTSPSTATLLVLANE